MKMTEQHRFPNITTPITCHAWNKNKTQIALSPNNHEVHIYEKNGNDWKLIDILNQHDLRVMGIDWAPNTNRIVTCAIDRNAYVWTRGEDGKWKPTLVLLRINRAATCVKWSPEENKFAVGSGARLISVCYFESGNDWWVSKHIKKTIHSTVTALDWHPNNSLLVAGSADFKVRVFAAHIKVLEKTPEPTPWGTKSNLGQLVAEFHNSSSGGGWIRSVSFSPSGNKICWVAHDSSINIADAALGNAAIKLKTEYLPFLSCTWITERSIIAGGYSCVPLLYSQDDSGQLVFVAKLDTSQKKGTTGLSAMKKFQSLDKQARLHVDDSLESVHQKEITTICLYSGTKSDAKKISTSGLDDYLVIWDLVSLENAIQGLKIV